MRGTEFTRPSLPLAYFLFLSSKVKICPRGCKVVSGFTREISENKIFLGSLTSPHLPIEEVASRSCIVKTLLGGLILRSKQLGHG